MRIVDIYHILQFRKKQGGWSYLIKSICDYPRRRIKKIKRSKMEKHLLHQVCSQTIPAGVRLSQNPDPRVVVSLTSYPKRLFALPQCLKSLLLQDSLPDRIVVYLGSDTKPEQIGVELREFQQYGVEFRFDTENDLKPHKKYYYAMQEFPNANVITVDDDLVYPNDMISSLLAANKKWPDAVCARRVHYIEGDRLKIKPYETWKKDFCKITIPSKVLFATGGSGVLYPPQSISDKAFDRDSIMNNSLLADDIWLKCMELLVETKVVYVPCCCAFAVIDNTQKEALKYHNLGEDSKNDMYLARVMNSYHITPESIYS